MTFSTLAVIEKLLKENLNDAEECVSIIREDYRKWYAENPERSEDDYPNIEAFNTARTRKNEAAEAYEEFCSKEWH